MTIIKKEDIKVKAFYKMIMCNIIILKVHTNIVLALNMINKDNKISRARTILRIEFKMLIANNYITKVLHNNIIIALILIKI